MRGRSRRLTLASPRQVRSLNYPSADANLMNVRRCRNWLWESVTLFHSLAKSANYLHPSPFHAKFVSITYDGFFVCSWNLKIWRSHKIEEWNTIARKIDPESTIHHRKCSVRPLSNFSHSLVLLSGGRPVRYPAGAMQAHTVGLSRGMNLMIEMNHYHHVSMHE